MGVWVHDLAHDGQLRWVGPEKGVVHLAAAAIINAFWDLWAKMEDKPVWKLLADMPPEKIVSLIDFRFVITSSRACLLNRRGTFCKLYWFYEKLRSLRLKSALYHIMQKERQKLLDKLIGEFQIYRRLHQCL
jgi:hypothetical protein